VTYDKIIAVDWSARSAPSPARPSKDAIFICVAGQHPTYHRTRQAAIAAIDAMLKDAVVNRQNVLIGFDFSFGYPSGFAKALTGSASGMSVWNWLGDHIKDAPNNANNRFDVAKRMNAMFDGVGPFWGCPANLENHDLPAKGSARSGHGMTERRVVEKVVPKAQSTWKLFTTGSVGSQSLLGLPYLWRLKQKYKDALAVWPLETGFCQPDAQITLVEIYPSLRRPNYTRSLEKSFPSELYHILDAQQVRWVCDLFEAANETDLWERAFSVKQKDAMAYEIAQEGWILGAGMAA